MAGEEDFSKTQLITEESKLGIAAFFSFGSFAQILLIIRNRSWQSRFLKLQGKTVLNVHFTNS